MNDDEISSILLVVGAIGLIIITQPSNAVVGAVGPGWEGYTKYAKPAPKLTSRFKNRTGQSNPTTPKRISVTGGGATELHNRLVRKYKAPTEAQKQSRFIQIKTIVIKRLRAKLAALQRARITTIGFNPTTPGTTPAAPPTQGANQVGNAVKGLLDPNSPIYEIWNQNRISRTYDRIRDQCNTAECFYQQEKLQITDKLEQEALTQANRTAGFRQPGTAQEDTPTGSTGPQDYPRTSPGGFGDTKTA